MSLSESESKSEALNVDLSRCFTSQTSFPAFISLFSAELPVSRRTSANKNNGFSLFGSFS